MSEKEKPEMSPVKAPLEEGNRFDLLRKFGRALVDETDVASP